MSNRLASQGRIRNEGGFTIIELMLTVVILIVGIVSVAQLVPVSVSSNLRNRNDTTALIAAQSLLEQVMQQPLTGAPGACPAPASADFWFCDSQGSTILLGSNGAAPNTPTISGCGLNSLGQIDFNSACSNYNVFEANSVTRAQVQLGMQVIQMHDAAGNTFRKVFIVGARAPAAGGFSNTTPTLTGVVGR